MLQEMEDEGKLNPEAEAVLQDTMGTLYIGTPKLLDFFSATLRTLSIS
jgi:hypothetical protein